MYKIQCKEANQSNGNCVMNLVKHYVETSCVKGKRMNMIMKNVKFISPK